MNEPVGPSTVGFRTRLYIDGESVRRIVNLLQEYLDNSLDPDKLFVSVSGDLTGNDEPEIFINGTRLTNDMRGD